MLPNSNNFVKPSPQLEKLLLEVIARMAANSKSIQTIKTVAAADDDPVTVLKNTISDHSEEAVCG